MKIAQKTAISALCLATSILFAGCGKKSDESAGGDARIDGIEKRLNYLESKDPTLALAKQGEQLAALFPASTATESGLRYIVTQEGSGEKPPVGATVTAHYTGTLLDGTKFDSSVDRGEPFTFPVGRGRVIPGWDEAFLDMKKGEKRKLIIPSKLAYGERSAGPIPPNSPLIFEVELIDFK